MALTLEYFRQRVDRWVVACMGPECAKDRSERNHRFLEEALELVQSCGATALEAHLLVDYVFNRPLGEKRDEVGGVLVTLMALCTAHSISVEDAAESAIESCWVRIDKIREKHLNKPKFSPLPGPTK